MRYNRRMAKTNHHPDPQPALGSAVILADGSRGRIHSWRTESVRSVADWPRGRWVARRLYFVQLDSGTLREVATEGFEVAA